MEVALQTEPHLLASTVNPTVGKRNVTLPIDNGLNLVEWRQRKEQARGQVTVFGRRLRVSEASGGGCVLRGKEKGESGELVPVLEIPWDLSLLSCKRGELKQKPRVIRDPCMSF